ARANILQYFEVALDDRQANTRDTETDMVTRLQTFTIDDQPIEREDILTILLTLVLAGLDTTRSALGFIFAHLATNPEDRAEIVDDPDLGPKAVEEFLRMYPLVFQVGREVQEDQEFLDLELKRGDVM